MSFRSEPGGRRTFQEDEEREEEEMVMNGKRILDTRGSELDIISIQLFLGLLLLTIVCFFVCI